jgi:tetratricopeptide (TPR) repeat protein
VLDAAPKGRAAPQFLYALAGVSADAKDFTSALGTARRLVTEFPDDERGDDALERVGAAAGKAREWPVTYEAYALLREKYPRSPFIDDSRLLFGEAQVETGHVAAGAKTLEQHLAAAPGAIRTVGPWFMLARARETTGDRAGAVEAYRRAATILPPSRWEKDRFFGYVGLLTRERHYGEVRSLLEPYIRAASPANAAEASLALGETLRAQGDGAAAIEYFMTAAYVAPDSVVGQRGLVAAGRTYAALKQTDAAATVYRKVLAQAKVPADLAAAARQGLAELGR